ncbi:MAG: protein translocase subunit SecD [Bryobacteraceae bacterium]|nr:protein translocase subunit SecD [Bryobacteraceae bacterium]
MTGNIKVRTLSVVAVILICIYGIIGLPTSLDELKQNIQKNIRLGLDLKGGSHLVLQVQLQDAFRAEADTLIERMKEELRKANVEFADMQRNDPQTLADAEKIQIDVKGVPGTKAGDFRTVFNDTMGTDWLLTAVNSTDYRLTMKPSSVLKLKQDTITQTLHTLEKKINGLGLAESTVQPRGRSDAEAELLVLLPGVDDPARIKQILKTAAMLELLEVKDGPFNTREEVLAKHGGVLPLNTQILRGEARAGGGFYLLARTAVVTGRDLRDAQAVQGQYPAQWDTNFVLTQEAAKRFERYTEANVGNRLAIALDKVVISAPRIDSKISDNGRITGAASAEEASDLALNLRAGSLPAGVEYLQELSVGPSLGNDSIRSGLISGLIGLIAVVFVMLAYYKKSGINATLALILNALILIGVLAYFNAVLTLPGIAGIILLIGMAVDSNVLIFERIREELREGKSVPAAIQAGFSKAFLTIIDTHVTTVVSCAFLFIFGTSAVRGFAVTLVVGLIANIFTAVFVSKLIFDWELSGKRQVQTLSI